MKITIGNKPNVNVSTDSSNVLRGPRGFSAYEIALKEGFLGNEEEWLSTLVGPKGDRGLQGETGKQGIQGPMGPTGQRGPKGDVGPQGPKGDVGPQGPKGENGNPDAYMTYIDLSTNMEMPTEMLDFVNKGGTYVAKNDGFLGTDGQVFTALHKGQSFKVSNFKDLMNNIGMPISDEENIIIMTLPTVEGVDHTLMKYGNEDFQEAIAINSTNINDYVNIDTSNFITRNMINSNYGIQIINGYLGISSATSSDINVGTNSYKPITPNNIDYAVKTKGTKYFATTEELQTLRDDTDKLLSEIETILDTVVSV